MANPNSSRYSIGVTEYQHKGKTITSVVGDKSFDKLTRFSESIYSYDVGYIPAGYEHRPDLISDLFYNTPGYWWLLMLVNNITDPFEGFNVNDRILIPKI